MNLLKRIYLFLTGAWLLFCMLRLILPYLGDYYKLGLIGNNHFTLTTFDNFTGKCKDEESTYILPLSHDADLNARLAKAQPESQFFFARCASDSHKNFIDTKNVYGMIKNWLANKREEDYHFRHESTGENEGR